MTDNDQITAIRQAVAQYMSTEGCSCCEGDNHTEHRDQLAELLNMERYYDDSGINYAIYLPEEEPTQ